ncbi:AAA family ATPase [Thermoanaerobacteraceae bacterium SP2]|nr:AAA family ATPase [Thermoanaerobacteraceae bacterium SP2]
MLTGLFQEKEFAIKERKYINMHDFGIKLRWSFLTTIDFLFLTGIIKLLRGSDIMGSILFIAPFNNIAETALKVAQKMNIDMVVEVGNMEEALQIADKYDDIDVIISRGGTAELLKDAKDVPVVEIKLSINDFMNAISDISKTGIKRIAVISRKSILEENIKDYEIFGVSIFFRPCKDVNKIKNAIDELSKQGIEAVIGDKMAIEFAQNYNSIETKLLDSGNVTIEMAIREALNIIRAKEQERLRAAQLKAIIDNIEEGIVAVTGDGRIGFYNNIAKKVFASKNNVINFDEIYSLLKYKNEEKILDVNNNKIFARIIPLSSNEAHKGCVISFQEVKNIQASERKIRLSLYEKGFYAKKSFNDIIGESEKIRNVIEKAKKYAHTDSNIFIYGQTGTGKEVFAQSIHNYSKRKNGPFVSVNCASLPHNLIESELFGYVEGAFTGARKGGKIGLIELAHGGTLFLDEIGEMPPDIQGRLLRVLQEKEIMRIGDDRIIPVDVRIICATNKDLLKMVREKTFREDLYYRINVLKLVIPPLNERGWDIIRILDFYLNKFNSQFNKNIKLSEDAVNILMEYDWPGNIRELRNLAEKLVALSDGDSIVESSLVLSLLSDESQSGIEEKEENYIKISEEGSLKDMEVEIIEQMLKRYNQEEVCRKLNISRVTLWRKMNKCYKNEIKEFRK